MPVVRLPSVPLTITFLAVLALALALAACSSSVDSKDPAESQDGSGGLSLVWEAWDKISQNYAGVDALDSESVAAGAMAQFLDLVDVSPYPFLTDVGRMRGQPPANVPGEMVDLWRAFALYSAGEPDFDPATVAEAVVAGMLNGLGDPSAAFLDAEQYPLARENLDDVVEGSYLGIGSRVISQDGQIVLFPFGGSPAESAGILPGDVLVAVAGSSVVGQSVQEVVSQVAGPKGTKVLLALARAGEAQHLEVEVFRGDIELQSVASQLIPGGIAYLRISRFRENTGEQVFSALEELNRFDMLALVLDLRSNPGGSAAAAKESAGQFLPDGAVFGFVEDQTGKRTAQYIASNEDRLSLDDLLIAVLVNDQTVREAETMAAALQDAGRATVFGTATFGDASAYEFIELSNGSAMYLPVSRWLTPSGKLLGRNGLTPDVEVDSVPEVDGYGGESQFNRAYEFLDSQLPPFR
ncbi:MAG: S41 family peptidase [Chloroflexi bacterium]|nr:S41 family peptidase [Chloroflexota bacterium]MDA1270420.1 S41 family peptidase [Chloroflexota bacterium]